MNPDKFKKEFIGEFFLNEEDTYLTHREIMEFLAPGLSLTEAYRLHSENSRKFQLISYKAIRKVEGKIYICETLVRKVEIVKIHQDLEDIVRSGVKKLGFISDVKQRIDLYAGSRITEQTEEEFCKRLHRQLIGYHKKNYWILRRLSS